MDVSAMSNYVILCNHCIKNTGSENDLSICLTIAHHHLNLYQISCLDTLNLNLWLLNLGFNELVSPQGTILSLMYYFL